MRIRTPLSTVAAVAFTLPVLATGSAAAAGHPIHHGRATVHSSARPNVAVYCDYDANAPFFVTRNGPLYAQGVITGCSNPAPNACHMTVDIKKQEPYGNWVTLGHKDGGWGPCGGTVTAQYKCAGTSSTTVQTQVTLTIEAGTTYSSSITDSSSERVPCY